jgi:hypothetical protein
MVGEPGLETDTRKLKFGDGITPWNSLEYSGANIDNNLLLETVDDRVASLIQAGNNISINYNDSLNILTIGATGLQLAGNYATLTNGKIPSSQLPSYVDDVVEYSNLAALPLSGESDKIYITLNNNKTYRWSGSAYIEISASPGSSDAVPEGSVNLYYTNTRASAAAPVQSVAGRTGVIALTASDISDFSSGVSETVDTLLVAGNNIDLNYNDSENELTVNFSIPVSNIDLHNGGPQSAQVLQFSDATKQSVITGPTPASGTNAQRIIVQGQRAQGGGEGGDVYVWGGDADANGGDIKIYAGDADNIAPNNGYGGYVNIDGGSGANSGGNVEITGGYSEGGQAGHVHIVGGPTSSGVAGDVNIKTNNSTNNWTFGSNGRLTLPNGNLIESQAGQGETNIQIVDNTSPFKIYTRATSGAKGWIYDSEGNLTLPEGTILSETNNTVSIAPPTAAVGQSLVIRPTVALWTISSSNYIEYGNPITISVTLNSWAYFGTVNYTISGTGVTPQSLGRALTGKLTFVSTTEPDTETITWTIPANSNITEFTLTLTSVDGTRSTNIETQNNPALYYNFEENGMPIGQFVTVTNDGMSNSEHSHVHLVAGDPSTVDIYLGDDDQYVKIEKNGGDVIVGTDNNNNHWTFGTDGRLTLPIDGDILDSNGTSVLGGGSTTVVDTSYSSTINTDASAGDIFDISLTGNTTLANPTNPVNGKTLRWRISQDSTGNRTVTLGNKFNIPGSATSPLPFSTAANKMDMLAATYHAGRDKWDVVAFVPGY